MGYLKKSDMIQNIVVKLDVWFHILKNSDFFL